MALGLLGGLGLVVGHTGPLWDTDWRGGGCGPGDTLHQEFWGAVSGPRVVLLRWVSALTSGAPTPSQVA